MKILISLFFFGAMVGLSASPVQVGDDRDAVVAELGEPQGVMRIDASEWMLYPQGKVWLEEDVVVKADLLTEEEFAEKQIREQEASIRQAQIRQEREQRGITLKEQLLASPSMFQKSAQERLEVWTRFQREYPEVNAAAEIAQAEADLRQVREAAAREDRIRDLEHRVRLAELRAEEAEKEIRIADHRRSRRYDVYEPYRRPVVYVAPHPYVRSSCKPAPVKHHHEKTFHSHRKVTHVQMKPQVFGSVKFSL